FKAEAGWHAREEDLLEGPVFSVELDENPRLALAKLEQLLGPPTLVVRSGGTWTNPETNAVEDKLHAYWRLKEPARDEDLSFLPPRLPSSPIPNGSTFCAGSKSWAARTTPSTGTAGSPSAWQHGMEQAAQWGALLHSTRGRRNRRSTMPGPRGKGGKHS